MLGRLRKLCYNDILSISSKYDITQSQLSSPSSVASLPALGPWALPPPSAERGLSLESIYRVSLTVDLCEGNKIISLKKLFNHSQLGASQKEKKSEGMGTCPVCPLVKTALAFLRQRPSSDDPYSGGFGYCCQ